MPAVCVIGAQWGDEGKGKLVDILGENADYVVRFQGGNNAGHTVVIGKDKYTFHALPSGAVRGVRSLVASDVVLDPRQLDKELKKFEDMGKTVDLGIDPRVAIIMPWHNDLDNAREAYRKQKTGNAIGTTAKGIGPCYEDCANRSGIMFHELVGDPKGLERKIRDAYDIKLKMLRIYGAKPTQKVNDIIREYTRMGADLKKYFTDVSEEIHEALKDDKKVIFEGAQGTLLDRKHGNYPKVTSSSVNAGGIFPSVGIGPFDLRTIGIIKAYVTKVGSGPVLTCLDKGLWPVDETKSEPEGNYIRKAGFEKGTTTGRPRRVGWFDIPVLKHTHRINNFSEFALTKLDCLAGLKKIKIAVAYDHNGKRIDKYPSWDISFLEKCKPVYEEFDGFTEDISRIKEYADLPENARRYVERIEELIEVPITVVSTGPGRDQTIFRNFQKF